MTLYTYIGSNRELPLGDRGGARMVTEGSISNMIVFRDSNHPWVPVTRFNDTSIQENEIEVYDSAVDLAGIHISPLHEGNMGIKKHFSNPNVYMIDANWGHFTFSSKLIESSPEQYKVNMKCFAELVNLMRDYGVVGDTFELYACWVEEEGNPRNDSLDYEIDFDLFPALESFELRDKQYIRIHYN